MAKIIRFQPKESNAYSNMKMFFEECNKLATCEFFLDTVEILARDHKITEKEHHALRRIGRQKRRKLRRKTLWTY